MATAAGLEATPAIEGAAAAAALGAAASCVEAPATAARGLSAFVELTKPRITRLVALTALGGFALSASGRGLSWPALLAGAVACTAFTAAASGGANTLNQCMEVSRDALMRRTRQRPLPSARVERPAAVAFGVALCLLGVAGLWWACGAAAAAVCAATIASYLFLYTPLKPRTVLNTWVGAVPGALPPLIGWVAAAGSGGGAWSSLYERGGWALFALMFVWQIPHFLAIAWMHREDYARGGYRMLPIVDPTGRATVGQVVAWSMLFIPASMLPALWSGGRVSMVYGAVALVSGVAFACFAWARLSRADGDGGGPGTGRPTEAQARRVFIASVVHLPVLMLALVADAALRNAGVW
jgi:protoheme IX farnesyltransferase